MIDFMRKFFSFCLLCLLAVSSWAQRSYQKKEFVSSSGDSLPYRLLRPENEKTGAKYPLVLFLHGAGERGNDNERQLVHGAQMFLNPVNSEKHPAFVLIPQCPSDAYWAYTSRPGSFSPAEMPVGQELSPVFKSLKELLDTYLALSQVDKNRIYVIGLSMGGMGTYDMAIRFPELFAVAVPICGTVNPDRLADARKVKFRIFHGDADNIVTVEGSRMAYKALKTAGADVEYIEFPGCGHDSWTSAFNYPGFMDWLFAQKKKK
jgi:predicted peptidase